jgi:hypothetical protein
MCFVIIIKSVWFLVAWVQQLVMMIASVQIKLTCCYQITTFTIDNQIHLKFHPYLLESTYVWIKAIRIKTTKKIPWTPNYMNKIWVLVWRHKPVERKTNIFTFYEIINVHETQGSQNIIVSLPSSSRKYLLNVFLVYLDNMFNIDNLIFDNVLWRYFMFSNGIFLFF